MTIDQFIEYAYSDIEESAYEGVFKKKGVGAAIIDKLKNMSKWIKKFITVTIPNFFKNIFKKNPKSKFSDAVKAIKSNVNELGITNRELVSMAATGGTLTAAAASKFAAEAKSKMQYAGKLANDTRAEMRAIIEELKRDEKNLTPSDKAKRKRDYDIEASTNKLNKEETKALQRNESEKQKAKEERDLYNKKMQGRYDTGYKEEEYIDANGEKKTRRKYNAGNRIFYAKNVINKWGRERLGIGKKKYLKDMEEKERVNKHYSGFANSDKEIKKDYELKRKQAKQSIEDEYDTKRNRETEASSRHIAAGNDKIMQLQAHITNIRNKMTPIEAKYNRKYKGDPAKVEQALRGDTTYQRLKAELKGDQDLVDEFTTRRSRLEKKMG